MRAQVAILALLLSACGGGGGEGQSAPVSSTPAPTGIAIVSDQNQVTLTWTDNGADTYHVYYATEAGQTPANYAAFAGGTWLQNVHSPLVISNLGPGPAYYFIVTAVKNGIESPASTAATAITRYQYQGSQHELVLDAYTGLEWQRCTIGQAWDDATGACVGTATMLNSYEAVAYQGADVNGWRLATLDELKSLMYYCMAAPVDYAFCNTDASKIHQQAFPNTPIDRNFHSATELAGYPTVYLKLNFGNGQAVGTNMSTSVQNYVRLVRPSTP